MKTLHLHLGAHKTASTLLQYQLELNRSKIKQLGFHLFNNADLRKSNFAKRIDRETDNLSQKQIKRITDQLHNEIWNKSDKIIISEENLLGGCGQFRLHKCIYPNVTRNLKFLKLILGKCNINIYLATRCLSTFIPSCYCESIKGAHHYFSFDNFYKKMDTSNFSWSILANTILKIFPKANIYTWDYKNCADNETLTSIVSKISTVPIKDLIIQNKPIRTSISTETINLLSNLDNFVSSREYFNIKRLIIDNPPWETEKKFQPLSLTELEFYKKKYLIDIEQLKKYHV